MKIQEYDPVCGKKMTAEDVYVEIEKESNGETLIFRLCCPECHTKFEENEEKYMRQSAKIEKNGEEIQKDLYSGLRS